MKKLFTLFTLACGLMLGQTYAQDPNMTISQPGAPIGQPMVMQDGGYTDGYSGYGNFQDGTNYGGVAGYEVGGYADNAGYADATNCQDNGTIDVPTGDCYCKRVCYKTCYCKVRRCDYVTKCYLRKRCRWVCQEFEKPCIKYVPVCVTERKCRYVPEYYCTEEYRRCPVWSCEIVEKQVPRYYYQHVCQPECAPAVQECCQ